MPVYITFFSRRAETFTSVPLDEKNKEGGEGNSLKPKEEEQCFFHLIFQFALSIQLPW